MQIDLHEMLLRDFKIDFPISGGTGNSLETPIIIHYREPNDCVSVEYGILRCLGIGRGVDWEVIQQTLLNENGRSLDQIEIRTRTTTGPQIITQVETYYFDITECFGR